MLGFVFQAEAQINSALPLTVGRGGAATAFNRNFDAIGINPSNLGWSDNKLFSFGLAGFGWNVQSQSLNLSDIQTLFLNRETQLTQEQKATFTSLFNDPEGLNYNFNAQWFAASVKIPKIGTIAIGLDSRVTSHIGLNYNASDIIFNGSNADVFQDPNNANKTVGELLDSTNITYNALRQFNVAYGFKLFDPIPEKMSLYGGVGFRYIWGMGHLRLQAQDGEFTGLSAFSDNAREIDYSGIVNFDLERAKNLFNAPGQGYALDWGASIVIADVFRAGISIVDIGKVTWNTNVLVAKDTTLRQPNDDGSDDFSWKEQAKLLYSEDGVMYFEEGEEFETQLPTRIRIGAGAKLTRFLQLGADIVAPINNSEPAFDKTTYAIGAQVNLLGMVKVSSGVSFNQQYGTAVPLGATIGIFGKLEAGMAFGDILTLFNGEDNPNASAGIGLLRINF